MKELIMLNAGSLKEYRAFNGFSRLRCKECKFEKSDSYFTPCLNCITIRTEIADYFSPKTIDDFKNCKMTDTGLAKEQK